MELKLFHKTSIRELKRAFSKNFPYLKIEFFKVPHSCEEGTSFQQKIADHLPLSEIAGIRREGIFVFQASTTVAEFEQRMQKEFGLPVQVLRKAGDVWIETIQTDKLALEKQNSMGEASCKPMWLNVNTLLL